ncbi:mechanosensitive ion channel [Sinomicrobium kalidii]|uniref:mechanosensitive ion channel family protein n=1 Tax=Sinomicrobium kalidii TaxID=2900738 RepID=UPI001E297A74|nr:mechanosensitive ion channel domain-containing protein [Sinomicrobium kalidii]UGU16541.1 mechanosensitive ion channel [Sinomicrobium kalidii]
METEKWIQKGMELIIDYAPRIVLAILIWIIGLWLFRRVVKYARKIMKKRRYDAGLQGFLATILDWALKILLIVIIMGTLGIQTMSFAAVIASAGLAIGLALQGSLANFAGGVLIMIFKPFRVGDFIEAQGISGTVKEIGIVNTSLNTFGNQLAIIPNGKLSNENIINYSAESIRRENIISGISYDSNIKKAKDILLDIANSRDTVLQDPAPMVIVNELADSSINLSLRYWTKNEHFWDCRWYVLEEIKYRFDAEGIEIPFPHQVEIQKQA